ncbi:MAG: hypothetical protein JRJ76_11990 [Deltaproteobacteria bacterium]|nr:hypothetical protein [Deltaproteobacteria bacterium]
MFFSDNRISENMKSFLFIVFLILTGCLAKPIVERPSEAIHIKQNHIFKAQIQEHAQAGDWIVTRGYHAADTLVSNVTGISLSHVGVYDQKQDLVIEAEGKGVHTTSLYEFIDKSHRLILIRPRWSTTQTRDKAVENARALVGKSYDFLGTIGFDSPSSYYCSELAVMIYQEWHKPSDQLPTVIKPGELYLYGSILYDTLPRKDKFNE